MPIASYLIKFTEIDVHQFLLIRLLLINILKCCKQVKYQKFIDLKVMDTI